MKNFLTVVAALVIVLGAYEWYNRERAGRYVDVANIAQGMQIAVQAKHAIMGFYQSEGKFPSSNYQLSLKEPNKYITSSLKSMEVTKGGTITLTFNGTSGVENGIVQLVPDDSNLAVGVQWSCTTPTYKDMEELMPQCKYLP